MKLIHRIIVSFSLLLLPFVIATPQASAADIRTGERIMVSSDAADIKNIYLFGDTVSMTAPVGNDLVTGAGKVDIDSPVGQSVMVGGGNVTIKNKIGNSLRAAGGNITIDSEVANDVLVTGGNVTITKNAKIGGDVLFAGGTLQLDAPVGGKVLVSGGQIDINNTVGKGVEAYVGQLTLGPNAVVNGDLKYTSDKQAAIDSNAKVTGQTLYTPEEEKHDTGKTAAGFFSSGALYMLVVDILLGLLVLYFFNKFAVTLFKGMKEQPVKNGIIGFAFLFLFPIAALFMLMLVMLGVAAFLFYGLVIIIAMVLAKLFVGWLIMELYTKRDDKKKQYTFDWKAVIIGPVVMFLIALIPVLGWFIAGIVFLIALGALMRLFSLAVKK